MRKKINYYGNSKVIKRLCELFNEDPYQAEIEQLRKTIQMLITDIYGVEYLCDDQSEILCDDTGEELISLNTNEKGIRERLQDLEDRKDIIYG